MSDLTFGDILIYFGLVLALVPVLLGITIFQKAGYGVKAMIILVTVSLICDTSNLLIHTLKAGTLITRTYSFIEFELISIFFISVAHRKFFSVVIVAIMILFPALVFTDFILSGERLMFDNLVMVAESIIFVLYSVGAFYLMMSDIRYTSITRTPKFWMVSAILLYFGGAIFVFSSVNYAGSISVDLFEVIWNVHAALHIAYITILSIAFWKVRKQYQ